MPPPITSVAVSTETVSGSAARPNGTFSTAGQHGLGAIQVAASIVDAVLAEGAQAHVLRVASSLGQRSRECGLEVTRRAPGDDNGGEPRVLNLFRERIRIERTGIRDHLDNSHIGQLLGVIHQTVEVDACCRKFGSLAEEDSDPLLRALCACCLAACLQLLAHRCCSILFVGS
jgi:hypothetical protein